MIDGIKATCPPCYYREIALPRSGNFVVSGGRNLENPTRRPLFTLAGSRARLAKVPPQNPEDARWFAEHVQPHEPALRAYLQRQFPKLMDVDDLVQESFVRVLRAKATGRIGCVRAYLFATARNAACALFRRPKVFAANPVTDPSVLRIAEEGPGVVEKVSTAQEVALLLDAIDALPARCREIFILRKLQGVPQKEIARRLELSEQTVQVQVARGAQKCAEFLRRRGVSDRFGPQVAPMLNDGDA